jgi:hypothetical protein
MKFGMDSNTPGPSSRRQSFLGAPLSPYVAKSCLNMENLIRQVNLENNPPVVLKEELYTSYIDDFRKSLNNVGNFVLLKDKFKPFYAIMKDIDLGYNTTLQTTYYPGIFTKIESKNKNELNLTFEYIDSMSNKEEREFNVKRINDLSTKQVTDGVANYYLLCNDFNNHIYQFVNIKIIGYEDYVSNLINNLDVPSSTNFGNLDFELTNKIKNTPTNLILFRIILLADTIKDFATNYDKLCINEIKRKRNQNEDQDEQLKEICKNDNKKETIKEHIKKILCNQTKNDFKWIFGINDDKLLQNKLIEMFPINDDLNTEFFEDINPYLSVINYIHKNICNFVKNENGKIITNENLESYLKSKCKTIDNIGINCIYQVDNLPIELAKICLYLLGYQRLDLDELEYFTLNKWKNNCKKNAKSLPGFNALQWCLNLSSGNENLQTFAENCLNTEYFEKNTKPIIISIDAVSNQDALSNVWKLFKNIPTFYYITPAQYVDGAGLEAKVIKKSIKVRFPDNNYNLNLNFNGKNIINSTYNYQNGYTFKLNNFFGLNQNNYNINLIPDQKNITIKPIKQKVYIELYNRKYKNKKFYKDEDLVYAMINKTMMDTNKSLFSTLIKNNNQLTFNYLNITNDIIQSFISSIVGPGMSFLINKQFGAIEHVIVNRSSLDFDINKFSIENEDYFLTDSEKIKKLQLEIKKLNDLIQNSEEHDESIKSPNYTYYRGRRFYKPTSFGKIKNDLNYLKGL